MNYRREQKTNHMWTEEERAIVRRDYKGTNTSAQEIAEKLGVTRFAVKGQAAKMGILRQKSPPWKRWELQQLEQLVHHKSIGQIAKILHRSNNAVKIKATRLKLKLRVREDWYTKADVMGIVGEDHHKVQRWIDQGLLKASWHFDTEPTQRGTASWHIEAKDLREFIINYSGELLGRNVDIQQIVWLLTDNHLKGGERIMRPEKCPKCKKPMEQLRKKAKQGHWWRCTNPECEQNLPIRK